MLARVSGGETIEITDRGHPVARLVPVGEDGSTLARLVAAGRALPPVDGVDAIHLATAQVLTNESRSELLAFVTYDRRLLDSAKAAGLPTASPGQE